MVRDLNMLDLYLCEDACLAADLLSKKLSSVLDKLAPVKTFQVRNNFAPWISKDIKNQMDARDAAQKKATDSQNETDWKQYRKLRNKVSKKVKIEKSDWQRRKLDNCSGSPSKVWKNILGWLNWTSSSSPSKLYFDNSVVTSPARMANVMNNYYITKVNDIRNALPPPSVDPLGPLKRMMYGCPTKLNLNPVHPDMIDKIIGELKDSKSCGIDYIDSYVLKLVRTEITPVVTHIINLSIISAVFPSSYKISKVVPHFKSKGDRLDPSSYRPVALLPIISKILERAVYLQMVEYMENPFGETGITKRRSNRSGSC